MLPGAHPSPVILQLENLFFLFFFRLLKCVFSSVCLESVGEREREKYRSSLLVGPMALAQSRCNVLVGSFPPSLRTCINDLLLLVCVCVCVCEKRSSGIGVAAYWILWARPKYFGAAFFQILLLLKTTFFCRSFLYGRPLYPVTCVQPIIDRTITERQ
jgi:hypothetical protein